MWRTLRRPLITLLIAAVCYVVISSVVVHFGALDAWSSKPHRTESQQSEAVHLPASPLPSAPSQTRDRDDDDDDDDENVFLPPSALDDFKCTGAWANISSEVGELNQTRADRLTQRFQLNWTLALPDLHTTWTQAAQWVTGSQLYPEHAPRMGAVLRAMATARIEKATIPKIVGINFKLMLTLAGGQSVLFKAQWPEYTRDWVTPHCVYQDHHIGEIAGFHLTRLLGFRRSPLTVGRILYLHRDIMPVASPELLHMIKTTGCALGRKRNQTLVKVKGDFWQRMGCDSGGRTEGAVILWMPDDVTFHETSHPWGALCKAVWDGRFNYFKPGIQSAEDICREAQDSDNFRGKPGFFLDLVDTSIVFYLVRNADTRLYVGTGKYAALMPILDNGRSFAYPDITYQENLAPLTDCCRVRESTYRRLQSFQNGSLGHVLREVTLADPLNPLLNSQHLQALDRRLHVVLGHIHRCICQHGAENVLVVDL